MVLACGSINAPMAVLNGSCVLTDPGYRQFKDCRKITNKLHLRIPALSGSDKNWLAWSGVTKIPVSCDDLAGIRANNLACHLIGLR